MTNNDNRMVTVTIDYPSVSCLKTTFDEASKNGFAYICAPLAHSLFRREFFHGKSKNRKGPFTRSDLCLSSFEDWAAVIGKISPYINCDTSNEYNRKTSEATLKQELSYACHLSLPAVIIPVNGPNVTNLSRVILSKLVPTTSIQIWIKVPLCDPVKQKKCFYQGEDEESEPTESEANDTWHWWNNLRTMTDSNKRVCVCVEVGGDVPAADGAVMRRWLGEPLRAVLLPTHVFVTNRKGFPVLTKPHQALVRQVASHCHDINFVVTGACRHQHFDLYLKYIGYLVQQKESTDPLATFTEGYEDFLQYPLQPLADNLESQTYEVFEKDPIKYNKYQEAIYHALLDRVPFEEKETSVQVVMVVGAGRGPLVTAALNAARKAQRRVKVYAVEKNPNAVVTLETKQVEEWRGEAVTVVSSDMRLFRPPADQLADLLVSELLGSFGDNELSPECLDGARHLMKDDAISIPCSYTSYLSPIQSMRLYNEVRGYKERIIVKESHFEMPYVVHQKNRFTIDQPQPLFTFHHPNTDEVPDNTRYKQLTFDVKTTSILHGFSGYFSTVLYKDTTLSIHPDTHSPGMFSWFPIYFPIKEPVHLKAGKKLIVNFWRLIDKEKVWYEWNISAPTPIPIHNPNGRSYSIKLH
ncbi:hypothetical protein LSTR_LSTR013098 [Laodelphax striatellus]|uniref:Protein arginine N-methyltransferase n=1 Tax=Laodelphax striatellus TaxID=195883 RepID=A0A482XKR4_LAOST|nr:hypothetical protein LSTR_LSTR013098 [Laodelphax striatellus]